KNFSHQIEALAAEWFQRPVQVAFELPANGAAARIPTAPRAPAPSAAPPGPVAVGAAIAAAAPPAPAAVTPVPAAPAVNVAAAMQADAAGVVYERSRLNTDLTFENFVTGKANQLARAA